MLFSTSSVVKVLSGSPDSEPLFSTAKKVAKNAASVLPLEPKRCLMVGCLRQVATLTETMKLPHDKHLTLQADLN